MYSGGDCAGAPGEFSGMEPAQRATGTDPQFGVQMQEMLAVTDYPLSQPQG